MPQDEVKTSLHGDRGPTWLFPDYLYSIISPPPPRSAKHQWHGSPTRHAISSWSAFAPAAFPLSDHLGKSLKAQHGFISSSVRLSLTLGPKVHSAEHTLLRLQSSLNIIQLWYLAYSIIPTCLPICLPCGATWGHVLFMFVLSLTKSKPSRQHIKAYMLGPHCLPYSIPNHVFLAYPDPATKTTRLSLKLARYILVQDLCIWCHCQKCSCLDIYKFCFLSFLKCCPLNEAFPLSNLKLQPDPSHTYSHSLSSFTFLCSSYHYPTWYIWHMYLLIIFLPWLKSKHYKNRDFFLFCLL